MTTSRRPLFRGCRYSVMFRPPSLLAPRIVPTAASTAAGQLGLLRLGLSCFVASARSRYANRPKTGNWRYGDLHPARHSVLSAAPITREEPSMTTITSIGLDLAKKVFQVHGVDAEGKVVVARKLRRKEVLAFFAKLPPCLVGMEACGSAHYWGREIAELGNNVKLMRPKYVKAYVKRGKTDAGDAAAICEAVTRPSMSFVCSRTADTWRRGSASCRRTIRRAARSSRRGSPRRVIAICAHFSSTARWPLCSRRRSARKSIPRSRSCSGACRPSRRRSRSPTRPRGSPGPSWFTAASTRPAIAPPNIERRRARSPDKRLGDG